MNCANDGAMELAAKASAAPSVTPRLRAVGGSFLHALAIAIAYLALPSAQA